MAVVASLIPSSSPLVQVGKQLREQGYAFTTVTP